MERLIGFIIIYVLLLPSTGFSADRQVTILQYEITSESETIGNMTLRITGDQNSYLIAEHSQVNKSWWWGTLDLRSTSIEKYNLGNLVSANSKVFYDDKAYWTTMEQSETGVWGSVTEVKNTSQKEIDEFAALSVEISNLLLPNLGQILSLSQQIFSGSQGNASGVRFARSQFDTTANQLPLFIQSYQGKELPALVNILDTETLKINESTLKDFGDESIQIGGQAMSTRHVQISDASSDPAHIWISTQGSFIPYIAQFTGTDDGLPITIQLISSPGS